MSNKLTLTLAFVAAFLLAANVKAEYVVLESSFGYYQTASDPGYGNYVTISAQESADGKGVTFTFGLDSDYSGGTMQMQSKGNGAGVLVYTASDDAKSVFNFSGLGTTSLNQLAEPYNGVNAYQLTSLNPGASMQGSSWLFDNTLSFTLNFAEGMGWDDFVTHMGDVAVGVHLAPQGVSSSMFIANDWKDPNAPPPPTVEPSTPGTATPEPTTIILVGLGIAGAAAYRRKMMAKERQ